MSQYDQNTKMDSFTKSLQKKKKIKVKKNATIKFIKTLIKFISENHTDEITYVRLLDN